MYGAGENWAGCVGVAWAGQGRCSSSGTVKRISALLAVEKLPWRLRFSFACRKLLYSRGEQAGVFVRRYGTAVRRMVGSAYRCTSFGWARVSEVKADMALQPRIPRRILALTNHSFTCGPLSLVVSCDLYHSTPACWLLFIMMLHR